MSSTIRSSLKKSPHQTATFKKLSQLKASSKTFSKTKAEKEAEEAEKIEEHKSKQIFPPSLPSNLRGENEVRVSKQLKNV